MHSNMCYDEILSDLDAVALGKMITQSDDHLRMAALSTLFGFLVGTLRLRT